MTLDARIYQQFEEAGALTKAQVDEIHESLDHNELPQMGLYPIVRHILHCTSILEDLPLSKGKHTTLQEKQTRVGRLAELHATSIESFCKRVEIYLQKIYAFENKPIEDMQKLVIKCQLFANELFHKCREFEHTIQFNPLYYIYWNFLQRIRMEYGITADKFEISLLQPIHEANLLTHLPEENEDEKAAFKKGEESVKIDSLSYIDPFLVESFKKAEKMALGSNEKFGTAIRCAAFCELLYKNKYLIQAKNNIDVMDNFARSRYKIPSIKNQFSTSNNGERKNHQTKIVKGLPRLDRCF